MTLLPNHSPHIFLRKFCLLFSYGAWFSLWILIYLSYAESTILEVFLHSSLSWQESLGTIFWKWSGTSERQNKNNNKKNPTNLTLAPPWTQATRIVARCKMTLLLYTAIYCYCCCRFILHFHSSSWYFFKNHIFRWLQIIDQTWVICFPVGLQVVGRRKHLS